MLKLQLVDLAGVSLPLLNEPMHPRFAQYEDTHTKTMTKQYVTALKPLRAT